MGLTNQGLRSSLRNVTTGVFTIPDSVVTLYDFEGTGDTTTATDTVGSNDATISGASYTTTAAVGGNAIAFDGTDDTVTSNNTVDLTAQGTTDGFGFGGFMIADGSIGGTTRGTERIFQLARNSDNKIEVNLYGGDNDKYQTSSTVGGSFNAGTSSGTISTSSYDHIWVNVDQTNITLYENNTQIDQYSHGYDITTIGSVNYLSGYDVGNKQYLNGKVDDYAVSNDPLDSSERQALTDRGN